MSGAAAASRPDAAPGGGAFSVLANRPFLLLWLSQVATQVGGNMVVYGLTVLVFELTGSSSAVSFLLLTFLVPAVIFSAIAGVFVDRVDGRHMLVATNLLRAAAFGVMVLVDTNIVLLFGLNIFVSIVTTFFAPTELSMLPRLVSRSQLVAANGLFTLTVNAAFAVGFALLGPLVVTVAGPNVLIIIVAVFYLVAAGFCFTLPSSKELAARAAAAGEHPEEEALALAEGAAARTTPEIPGIAVDEGLAAAGQRAAAEGKAGVAHQVGDAARQTYDQLREGVAYIRSNRVVAWSLLYLGIGASLIGVLGVLGPDFATTNLGLAPKDFVVVVLPLGAGVVTGVLFLNSYARLFPRRRLIESGLVSLGVLLLLLAVAGPIATAIQNLQSQANLPPSLNVSLLAIVVVIAFLAGVAYSVVAIPAQTQLQEDIPEDVRGRVFGVLNMLVSIASFVPIIIVGPISDLIGSTTVIVSLGVIIGVAGISSIIWRRTPPAAAPPARRAGEPPGVL
ncbi:MAG: MFS transporter [Chloroflexi bacterium]|nr:MFS transporter [Chloroflexota bacterium]